MRVAKGLILAAGLAAMTALTAGCAQLPDNRGQAGPPALSALPPISLGIGYDINDGDVGVGVGTGFGLGPISLGLGAFY
jgi:hypothetical protein